MRDYGKIVPGFWTGATGNALKAKGPEAVLVAVNLMTSPHANMIGLYRLPISYLAEDTGLPFEGGFEGASKGLRSCCEVGFCAYDEATQYVFVYEFARYQTAESLKAGDNRHKAVLTIIDSLNNCPLLPLFYGLYAHSYNLPEVEFQGQVLGGFEGGFEGGPATLTKPVSSKQETVSNTKAPKQVGGISVVVGKGRAAA